IDLMNGRIVQLVQGERKALEFDDFEPWIRRFTDYPLVQLIDLDAAMRTGSNRELLGAFCRRLPCQVGGGIRDAEIAREILGMGAKRVILGSALISDGKVDIEFARDVSREFGAERLVFAVDSREGKVAVAGWRTLTSLDAAAVM